VATIPSVPQPGFSVIGNDFRHGNLFFPEKWNQHILDESDAFLWTVMNSPLSGKIKLQIHAQKRWFHKIRWLR